MNNIIIIGAGNMGRALAKGLLQNHRNRIYFKTISDLAIDDSDFNDDAYKNRVFFHTNNDFFYDIKNPWLFLAVKPKDVTSVIKEITDIIMQTTPKALISVAAGITLETIKLACSITVPVIRTMPNISVANGNGVIGYLSDTQTILAEFIDLCTPLGLLYKLSNDDQFHLFTAIAGSAPAYFFHTIEAMAEAASRLGMTYQEGEKIATQVFLGAASLLKNNSPTELRQAVTSPNGTTQAGLEVLMHKSLNIQESHLAELLCKTLKATQERSQNIA